MPRLTISLPDDLQSFVDERVRDGGYESVSEYIVQLIRKDQARHQLRRNLLDGLESDPGRVADDDYFGELREHVRRNT